jgi:hypothetical protein
MLNDNNTLFRVRDSSEKPAMSEANEDLQRIARPRSDSEGDTPKKEIKVFKSVLHH